MINWFKELFGFAEGVVTLAERHAKASKVAQNAIATFDAIVYDLEHAAGTLAAVAVDARTEAERLLAQAEAAAAESQAHVNRAAKIRDLTA